MTDHLLLLLPSFLIIIYIKLCSFQCSMKHGRYLLAHWNSTLRLQPHCPTIDQPRGLVLTPVHNLYYYYSFCSVYCWITAMCKAWLLLPSLAQTVQPSLFSPNHMTEVHLIPYLGGSKQVFLYIMAALGMLTLHYVYSKTSWHSSQWDLPVWLLLNQHQGI